MSEGRDAASIEAIAGALGARAGGAAPRRLLRSRPPPFGPHRRRRARRRSSAACWRWRAPRSLGSTCAATPASIRGWARSTSFRSCRSAPPRMSRRDRRRPPSRPRARRPARHPGLPLRRGARPTPAAGCPRACGATVSTPSPRRSRPRPCAPTTAPRALTPPPASSLIGARSFLIAFNVWLRSADVRVAREVARAIRERDGGLPGVQALGFYLESRGRAQVSINLLRPDADSARRRWSSACATEAAARGVEVDRGELIGLLPEAVARRSRPRDALLLPELRPATRSSSGG